MATKRASTQVDKTETADDPGLGAPPEQSVSPNQKSSTSPLGELFGLTADTAKTDLLQDLVHRQVDWIIGQHVVALEHTVVLLHDPRSITRSHANRIYEAVSGSDRAKPILLVISSRGGDIPAAYFIAKVCRESTDQQFKVAIPREAKSAATLISCGADEIHMGSLSELGPIDPQFGSMPALAVKHSVDHIAQLASQYPAAQAMFSDYLTKTLRIDALGYYERVAESAVQYAERLLNARLLDPDNPDRRSEIAKQLVYAYKDHGFVIDWREARELLGASVVKFNSAEYNLANQLYGSLDFIEWFVREQFGRDMSFAGAPSKGCWMLTRSE